MLHLAVKEGKSVVIDLPGGERITITVTAARAGCARLGIDAPRDIPVNRSEVAADIARHGRR